MNSIYLLVDIQFAKMPVLRTLWLIVVNAIYQNVGATHLVMVGVDRYIIFCYFQNRVAGIFW